MTEVQPRLLMHHPRPTTRESCVRFLTGLVALGSLSDLLHPDLCNCSHKKAEQMSSLASKQLIVIATLNWRLTGQVSRNGAEQWPEVHKTQDWIQAKLNCSFRLAQAMTPSGCNNLLSEPSAII